MWRESIDLGESLRLGASEVRAGGRPRIAILADVCESLIGAVFLDGGYKAAKALVERYWMDRMRKPARPLRDPKTVSAGMGAGPRSADTVLSRS